MYWSNFFHIYQPFDQRPEILKRIVNESYRPLISGWKKNPTAHVTLNINACLTENLLKYKYLDVIADLKELARRGQLEFTASGKFHPFLPILPKQEIVRQIKINEETNAKIFGNAYAPCGFFPPEMGYSRKVGEVVRDLGYKWIVLDEIAFNGKIDEVNYDRLYKFKTQNSKFKSTSKKSKISSVISTSTSVIPGQAGIYNSSQRINEKNLFFEYKINRHSGESEGRLQNLTKNDSGQARMTINKDDNNLYIFFRERRMSNLIMAAMLRTPQSLWEAVGGENDKDRYLLTAMDGETFGHHRPGLDKMLENLYIDSRYQLVTVSELLNIFNNSQNHAAASFCDPISCSWATSEAEIEKGQNFYLYYNPKNKLHVLQKKLIDLAEGQGEVNKTRELLDQALSCNHMWWSNPDAWWSIEEIEKGAYNLKKAILSLRASSGTRAVAISSKKKIASSSTTPRNDTFKKAEDLYQKIMAQAFAWQRQGLPQKLHEEKEQFKKIPFKERAKPGEMDALVAILKSEEQKAVDRHEYELAIRWRDSRYKLEKGLDMYDFVHIVDQMRAEGKLGQYEELSAKYREEYKKHVPGQADK